MWSVGRKRKNIFFYTFSQSTLFSDSSVLVVYETISKQNGATLLMGPVLMVPIFIIHSFKTDHKSEKKMPKGFVTFNNINLTQRGKDLDIFLNHIIKVFSNCEPYHLEASERV